LAAANSVIENLKIQLEIEKEKRENALQEILTLSNQLNLAESSISNTENKLKLVEQEKVSLEESTNEWIEKYTSLEDAVENEKHWLEKTTDGAAGNKTENVSFTVLGGLSALSLLKIFGPMLARRGSQKIGDKITGWNPPAPEQRPDPPPPGWMKGDSGEWVPDPRYSTPIVNSSAQPPTGYVKHEHLGTVQHIHKGLENTVQTAQPQFDIPPEKFPGPINPTQTPPKVTNELDPGFLPHGYVKKKN